MDDERIERRALLGGEDFRDGIWVEGVAGQAIDGLGGKGDDFPGGEQAGGFAHGFFHVFVGGLDDLGIGHAAGCARAEAGRKLDFPIPSFREGR